MREPAWKTRGTLLLGVAHYRYLFRIRATVPSATNVSKAFCKVSISF